MKLTRRRRLWWALMYQDPRPWGLWRRVAWTLPVVVAIVTAMVWHHGR